MFDIAIIGAGLLGSFSARALSEYKLSVVVLEEREDVCTGLSKANTGVVYTGCDTPPGTLKTELCVRASARFDALCRELDVPFSRCGSLMVSFGDKGDAVLDKKYAQGMQNGVPGLRMLSREETLERESALSSALRRALYAPGTGTVDPWALGIAAFENARANGAEFRFSCGVRAMTREDGVFRLFTDKGEIRARCVLNCAGLAADGVRELLEKPLIRHFPTAGDYIILDDTCRGTLRHVIFHQSEEKGKGLILVPTVDGNVLIGRTKRPWNGRDRSTDIAGLRELRSLCREVVPALDTDARIRSFATLRPKPYAVHEENGVWVPEGKSIGNFTILEEAGLWTLLGIKTPGLTCSAELGKLLAGKLVAYLGGAEKKPDFDPVRRGIPRVRDMDTAERAALIEKDPAYGRIVCRCREISLGEIRDAVERGAVTADGVKRRCGAGMGRCQGSHCLETVLQSLAAKQGCAMADVSLDAPGSKVLYD